MSSVYQFKAETMTGQLSSLDTYKGKVLLIVNTASKCGFTPQFEGLEALYNRYQDKGLEVLGFPCNQFGKQDPGDNTEIQEFCQVNYGVSFPMHTKIDVNGPNAHALYQFMKDAAPGILGTKAIKWNFTKFLISRQGQVIKRFSPTAKPEELKAAIEAALTDLTVG